MTKRIIIVVVVLITMVMTYVGIRNDMIQRADAEQKTPITVMCPSMTLRCQSHRLKRTLNCVGGKLHGLRAVIFFWRSTLMKTRGL